MANFIEPWHNATLLKEIKIHDCLTREELITNLRKKGYDFASIDNDIKTLFDLGKIDENNGKYYYKR